MPLAEKLATTHTCYIPDLPGFGSTNPPDHAWTVDNYADFTFSFIKDLNLGKPDVLAHSFGGRIMLKLAARIDSQQYVGKILITGGAGMKPRRKAAFYLKKYTAKSLKAPFLLLPHSLRSPAMDWLRNTALWRSLGSGDYQKLQGVMRETFVKTVSEYLEPCMPGIEQEILLLWGKDDEATPLYQAQRMEKGIPSAALVIIQNAGHYAFLDQPSQFFHIAKAFLDNKIS